MNVIEPVSAVSIGERLASTPAAYERKSKGPNPTPDPFLFPFRHAPTPVAAWITLPSWTEKAVRRAALGFVSIRSGPPQRPLSGSLWDRSGVDTGSSRACDPNGRYQEAHRTRPGQDGTI